MKTIIGAFVVLIFATPFSVQAGLYTAISSMFGSTTEEFAASTYNSQNIPLLEAPNNIKLAVGGGDVTIVDNVAIAPDQRNVFDSVDVHGSDQISLYVVRKGETLSQIASMFGVTVNTILWSNNLAGGTISEGQTLVILPISGVKHTIKSGDTLETIAKKYGSDAEEIRQYNDLAINSKLAAGDELIVPDGELAMASHTTAPVSNRGKVDIYSKTVPPASYGAPKNPLPMRAVPAGYFTRPLTGGHKTQGIHGYNAVDIGAAAGTPLVASAAGTVIVSRNSGWNGGYGNYVVIKHDNGTQTLYAHMSIASVSVGQYVAQGQAIGAVGSTGKSTGPHVHFEIRGAKNPF